MYGIVLSLWSGDVREPLSRQAGPLQGMGHDKVVEEGCVLLPYLVLLVDDSLLHRLVISWVGTIHTADIKQKEVQIRLHA